MNYKAMISIYMCFAMLIISSCQETKPNIVYITATPNSVSSSIETPEVDSVPTLPAIVPSVGLDNLENNNEDYTVQPGDTLSGIAVSYNTTIENLMQINSITNPDVIEVGQIIKLPQHPTQESPDILLLVNSRFIPETSFDVREFMDANGGSFSKQYEEEIIQHAADGSAYKYTLDVPGIIEEISVDFSVDARLLIAILEYRSQYISAERLTESSERFPLIASENSNVDRSGLYRQLSWAANQLNRGYYTARYSTEQQTLEFTDGTRILLNSDLNATTSALQYFFSLNNTYNTWLNDIDLQGFVETYRQYFEDPLQGTDLVVPYELSQPQLQLPFEIGDIWYFTGGSHGGWGSGSAWSAIDFAPPDNNNLLCYISAYWITAVSDGVIARSDLGTVVLDLDGDGNESTGWNIVYLHVASQDRISTGVVVKAGDRIGHASCEGGFSTATHLHIGRKYNGEWVPTDCLECANQIIESFTMSDWSVVSIPNQEYQGYLINSSGDSRTAEQGRDTMINQIQLEDSS